MSEITVEEVRRANEALQKIIGHQLQFGADAIEFIAERGVFDEFVKWKKQKDSTFGDEEERVKLETVKKEPKKKEGQDENISKDESDSQA